MPSSHISNFSVKFKSAALDLKTVKIAQNPLLNPRIFWIWDLKNAQLRARNMKNYDFWQNAHLRAGNDSNHVFFEKSFIFKKSRLKSYFTVGKHKIRSFFYTYFFINTPRMRVWSKYYECHFERFRLKLNLVQISRLVLFRVYSVLRLKQWRRRFCSVLKRNGWEVTERVRGNTMCSALKRNGWEHVFHCETA